MEHSIHTLKSTRDGVTAQINEAKRELLHLDARRGELKDRLERLQLSHGDLCAGIELLEYANRPTVPEVPNAPS